MVRALDSDERAASEVLGFVLVFSVIVASVGALYVSGVGSLSDARDAEQFENAERAFVALAETFETLQRGRAPARGGEVRVAGGRLRVATGTTFDVRVEQSTPDVRTLNRTLGGGALVYTFDDRAVRYDGGAVVSGGDGGSVMVGRPAFSCTADRALVSTVEIDRPSNATSASGRQSVLVVGRRTGTELVFPPKATVQDGNRTTTVTLSVESSPNRAAWERYLDANGWTETGTGFECTTRRVYVRQTSITVEIRS